MEKVIPGVTLNSGSVMPVLGMGTAAYPLVESEEVKLAILNAIKNGYRHLDTAALYQSEESLGEAVSEAIQIGLTKSRDELFITSKLWSCDAHPDRVVPALQNSLRKLKLEYLDLYLIHWPLSSNPAAGHALFLPKDSLLTMDYKSVWTAMEECQKLALQNNVGLKKSIGVDNFSCKKLQTLLDTVKIPPAVNQVEMNPVWQNLKLRDFCKANNIILTAYSPLGGKGTPWGSNAVHEERVLHEIAEAKGKTHAQVCLRWIFEQGVSLLVKSYNKQRMKENMMIFDWELTQDELEKISKIPQRRGLPGDIFVSELEAAPFKTIEELWDGEV
ncbi:non-functional NADPH-dependent codeinone reductase 2-like [Papaver somniferum]|uniref:non-functional NADPH-dependent codeinone reductase 2-like n=1 Tax=Papaver somniferum TaxID=3469 RepID=UPI000E6F4A4E|nr:non-functional NADPH-dependent codeinone reductase 2-like [Papaver somniferum]